MTYYFDMDGVIADYHGYIKGNWKLSVLFDTFVNLPPFEYNVNVMNTLINEGNTVYVLTKAANAAAIEGKKVWLHKYVPALPTENVIAITKGRKVDFIRENGILIDDDEKNCKQWEKAGYKAIHLTEKGMKITLKA